MSVIAGAVLAVAPVLGILLVAYVLLDGIQKALDEESADEEDDR